MAGSSVSGAAFRKSKALDCGGRDMGLRVIRKGLTPAKLVRFARDAVQTILPGLISIRPLRAAIFVILLGAIAPACFASSFQANGGSFSSQGAASAQCQSDVANDNSPGVSSYQNWKCLTGFGSDGTTPCFYTLTHGVTREIRGPPISSSVLLGSFRRMGECSPANLRPSHSARATLQATIFLG